MKLKDKKIDICEYQYTSDAVGNRVKTLVTLSTVWAYFRQLSMKELYGVFPAAFHERTVRRNYAGGRRSIVPSQLQCGYFNG